MKNKLSTNKNASVKNENVAEPCLVCGSATLTLHYQVIICYACAAFYRRSVKINQSYVCQRNDGNCDVANRKVGKPMCRYCRYKKCLEIGIRDSKAEKDDKEIIEEKVCKVEMPKNLPEHETPITESFEEVFKKAFIILEEQSSPFSNLSAKTDYIEAFGKLLSDFMVETKPKQTLILINNDNIRLNFLKDFYLNSAKMLVKFPPFASLPLKEKIILHQEFWQNFHCLERAYQACKYYGYDQNDYRTPLDNYQYYDSSKPEKHFSRFANHKPFILFFQPLIAKAALLQNLIKKLKITEFELTYVCLLLLWNRYELSEMHDSTHELGAKIIEQASEDLHNYYIEELRMQSYAARQAQLFKLAHVVELFVCEKTKTITAKNLFEFSKEIFPYCTFELSYYDFVNKKAFY
uniref:Nuclear receptor n=1 Tax=Panagrolaimus sp. PS1159 TaxID=55785 RepID=A0AC35GND1_9BILA